ncbi:MAG: site-2 protease family protein [Candidatus Woesearchaeota archaeon]
MVSEFLANHWLTLSFYVLIITLLIVYRKKFEFQARIIALRRTKFGIRFINKYAKKYREFIKLLGYIGIGIGYAGMIYISIFVIRGFIKLFTQPKAPAAVSLVLPGVNVPGSPLTIPLWVIIPLFIVVVIHEAGHGLVAKAHKIPIKNTGIAFFGPLAGAFVEPDEKKVEKSADTTQYSIFAAGPFANALTAIVAGLLVVFVFAQLVPIPFMNNTGSMVTPDGFSFAELQNETVPAAEYGLEAGVVYTHVNGKELNSTQSFSTFLNSLEPEENVTFTARNGSTVTVVPTESPEQPGQGYLGVLKPRLETRIRDDIATWKYHTVHFFGEFFFWIHILSLGLGAFNLLPLGPVDGGQMMRLSLRRIYGDEKGNKYWAKMGLLLFIIVLFLIFFPMLQALF